MTKQLKTQSLSPKITIDVNEPVTVGEASSLIIQALTGGVSVEMRAELIVGCLKHLTGKTVTYDATRQKFKIGGR